MTLDETISAYFAAWNEKDEAARSALPEKCWSDAGVYEDPRGVVPPGRAALHTRIVGFHQAFPRATMVATSKTDEHHGKINFTWKVVSPDGTIVIEGRTFGELDGAGRIAHIVGFFGPPPPL